MRPFVDLYNYRSLLMQTKKLFGSRKFMTQQIIIPCFLKRSL
ncbi:hypothetical protein B0G84_5368 [Paraburkholderia sp. BL8N3]|nr:hypothetical protein B0G84_5368 [Paraburkholderia sp. BL8N3]